MDLHDSVPDEREPDAHGEASDDGRAEDPCGGGEATGGFEFDAGFLAGGLVGSEDQYPHQAGYADGAEEPSEDTAEDADPPA